MSKNTKRIYEPRSAYPDRSATENLSFSELSVLIKEIDTGLLLLNSKEEPVLLTVLNHITIFARKRNENIIELKAHNLLDILLEKSFFMDITNIFIKRFALFLLTLLMDNYEKSELETAKNQRILENCYDIFLQMNDDFCLEYICYIVNIGLRDPQVALSIQSQTEFLEKMKAVFNTSENPDTVFNTIEALDKILQVQSAEEMLIFTTMPDFPIDRIMCELNNQFVEIRLAALKILKTLLVDTGEQSVFEPVNRCHFVLKQLVKVFCENLQNQEANNIIEVLATALRSEKITKIFFEHNLFELVKECSNQNDITNELRCNLIHIFAETAKYTQYLSRIHLAGITDMLITCLQESEPAPGTFVITGLSRIIELPDALRRLVAEYEAGVLNKLLTIVKTPEMPIKTREQAAELIGNLLRLAFRDTADKLITLNIGVELANIIHQGLDGLSIDLILAVLTIIESLAQNEEYRSKICEHRPLSEELALLLMGSYAHSILVNNIFRCLCTIIDEEPVREILLENYIVSSIKRALKSVSNLVKTAVTNFILQTTRFNEFIDAYIDRGILEVLMTFQKHAFCVSTWGPAIESILSKCPTMKFCVRNALGFTDITAGTDFFVSKRQLTDFRQLQNILCHDCSPLDPILVVNFDRPDPHEDDIVCVPDYCMIPGDGSGDQKWVYCKRPGDPHLPQFLDALNETLALNGLMDNPAKVRRCIDFDNVAKRCKIVAEAVANIMNQDLKILDLNTTEECSRHIVRCHLQDLRHIYHNNFIPLGVVRSGCQFERAVLFKCLADQIGLPCTLQRSVDGRMVYNEVPLPLEMENDVHCDKPTLKYMPWRMLRPTHIVDLMYNVGELYPLQSRQTLQYLRLY